VPDSFHETGSWVWRTSITRTPGIASVPCLSFIISSRPAKMARSFSQPLVGGAEYNRSCRYALDSFPNPDSPSLSTPLHGFISSKQAFDTHNTQHIVIIIFHQRLNDENAMQICYSACNTDSDPACCLQRQMALQCKNFLLMSCTLPSYSVLLVLS